MLDNTDFDTYPENSLNTKTFAELDVQKLDDVDVADIFLYLRDKIAFCGNDLRNGNPREVEDVSFGINCQLSAMYLNMALRAFQGLSQV
jgi:hypothetical protein